MPNVSVIIPTYNHSRYLPQSINSVLCQEYEDFEIIIVDDGSRDDTHIILNNYSRKYPNKIRCLFQTHRGVSASRNEGIKIARGEFIAFQDDDDIWFPNFLKVGISYLDTCDAIKPSCYNVTMDSADREIKRSFGDSSKINKVSNTFAELLKKNFIGSPTGIIKADCFKVIGLFDEILNEKEDWDLWIRIAEAEYLIRATTEPLYIYRKFESRANDKKRFLGHVKGTYRVIEKYKKSAIENHSIPSDLYATIFWDLARIALYKCKNILWFIICLYKSMQYDFSFKRIINSLSTIHKKMLTRTTKRTINT